MKAAYELSSIVELERKEDRERGLKWLDLESAVLETKRKINKSFWVFWELYRERV